MNCIGSLLEQLASLLAAPQVFGAMYVSLLAGNLWLQSDCVPLERSLVPHIHCKYYMQVLHHAQYQRGSLFVTDTAHWVTCIGCRLTCQSVCDAYYSHRSLQNETLAINNLPGSHSGVKR